MRRSFTMLVLALALAATAPIADAVAQSPFIGFWSGTWTDKGLNQSGKAALAIDSTGRIVSGNVANSTVGASSPLTGMVQDDGAGTFTYSYDGRTVYRGTGRFVLKGAELIGDVDFIQPGGRVFGHGRFAFTRVLPHPASRPPTLKPAAPPTSQTEGNAAASAQDDGARP